MRRNQQLAIFAAKSNSLSPLAVEQRHNSLIDLAKHHFHYIHGGIVGDA